MRRWGKYRHCGPNPCDTLTWEELYGSSLDNNLPQHKKHLHIGNMWIPCPYSTQAIKNFDNWQDVYGITIGEYEDLYGPVDRYSKIRNMLGLSETDPLPPGTGPNAVDHRAPDGREIYLRPAGKGIWGYECIFEGCPYFLDTGKRYFYI